MTDVTDALPEGAIRIKRDWNVSDGARNSYGIVDTNPDPDDPAIALAIRIHATGERIGRVLRLGDHVHDAGLGLVVAQCRTGDDPLLVLVPDTGHDSDDTTGADA